MSLELISETFSLYKKMEANKLKKILQYEGISPEIHDNVFLAAGTYVIGDIVSLDIFTQDLLLLTLIIPK